MHKFKIKKIISPILLVSFFLSSGLAFAAQEQQAEQAQSTETAAPVAAPETKPAEAVAQPTAAPAASSNEPTNSKPRSSDVKTAPGNVTIDFKDAEIQSVLRVLSLKSGVNIVAGKDVGGTVTIRLVNVPWEKALDIILKTYGFAYDRDENIIRVTTLDNLKKEDLSTQVFPLGYSQAAEMEKSITDSLSDRGKVRSDTRSNSLIVTDMPTTLQKIDKIIKSLDLVTPQVLIEAKIIELTLGDADKLGIKWNLSANLSGSSRPSSFPFQAFNAPRQGISQFLLENDNAGLTFSPDEGPSRLQTFPLAATSDFQLGTLDFSEFSVLFDMIKSRSDARILSEPHVVTLNNKEAKILIGDILAIPTFERNATTGKMEITGYTDKDVGIKMTVTPQINNSREIVVDVTPEITALLGYDDITADIKAPHFSSRSAKTQVRVQDGQTIVIGGLIKETKSNTKTEVPFLGRLPLLDKLFSHNDGETEKTDLLFFMTVHVLDDKKPPQGHSVEK